MLTQTLINNRLFKKINKYSIFLLIILTASLGIRFYFFPSDIPLNSDALYYFWYSSDINLIGQLPNNWAPSNIGWPIFVSIFFNIINSNEIYSLMQIQRILSVIISCLLIIPVYFLCKKFVAKKFALIGASLIAFDPRLMINSLLGITDPLYYFLSITGLLLFLSNNKKIVYFSFAIIALATIVRVEGLAFFLVLSIMFFIRYRKEKYKIFLKYLIVLGIFTLIILPVSLYRIDVTGSDGIFMRSIDSGNNLIVNSLENENSSNKIIDGLQLFFKFLIWIMIPNFIIFIPLGLFLILRNRNFEKNTIILSAIIVSLPALYAYISTALDTRYLYVLFPIFSILTVLSIEKIIRKRNKSNIIIIIIIISIFTSSLVFYDYKKIDYEHEEEAFNIMKKVSTMVTVTNVLYQESSYFKTIQTIEQWPNTHSEMGLNLSDAFNIYTLPTNNFDSIKDYIIESKEKGLTHIIIDNKEKRQDFLKEIFSKETNYPYLEKIYDSKIDGFEYHLKVFKIDYELLN